MNQPMVWGPVVWGCWVVLDVFVGIPENEYGLGFLVGIPIFPSQTTGPPNHGLRMDTESPLIST